MHSSNFQGFWVNLNLPPPKTSYQYRSVLHNAFITFFLVFFAINWKIFHYCWANMANSSAMRLICPNTNRKHLVFFSCQHSFRLSIVKIKHPCNCKSILDFTIKYVHNFCFRFSEEWVIIALSCLIRRNVLFHRLIPTDLCYISNLLFLIIL